MKLTVLAIAALVVASGEVGRGQTHAPTQGASQEQRHAAPTVVNGKARFQVLTPALVRMEYSPSGEFTDPASVAVVNRENWPHTPFERCEEAGWLTISS